jgi:hypothetical protein
MIPLVDDQIILDRILPYVVRRVVQMLKFRESYKLL